MQSVCIPCTFQLARKTPAVCHTIGDVTEWLCVIDQAPGQYRPTHALTAAPFGHVSSMVLPGCFSQ